MIQLFIVIALGVGAYFGIKTWEQERCERAWMLIDKCKTKYSLDSCKSIYLPKSCNDPDVDTE